MKTVGIEQATLDACVREAQRERVVVTHQGKPVALIIGVEGLDREQIELGTDAELWQIIAERCGQRSASREELERLNRLAVERRRDFAILDEIGEAFKNVPLDLVEREVARALTKVTRNSVRGIAARRLPSAASLGRRLGQLLPNSLRWCYPTHGVSVSFLPLLGGGGLEHTRVP